jgi:hypothetical protein
MLWRVIRAAPGAIVIFIALTDIGGAIQRGQNLIAQVPNLTGDQLRTFAVIIGIVAALVGVFWDKLPRRRAAFAEPPSRLQSGKKGSKKIAPYRLAIDTTIAWLYRRKHWDGLSADGRYREPAPAFFAEPLYDVLKLSGPYEPQENIQPEPDFEGPHTYAMAGVAQATVAANDASAQMTGALKAVVTPGPNSPTLHQVSYQTDGRRHFAFDDYGRQPKAIRFSQPEDRMLRSGDLPFEMPCGQGKLVVEKFYSKGAVIDEDGTVGDPVAFVAYFDD